MGNVEVGGEGTYCGVVSVDGTISCVQCGGAGRVNGLLVGPLASDQP